MAGLTFSLSQESGWRLENKEPCPSEYGLRFHPNLFHHEREMDRVLCLEQHTLRLLRRRVKCSELLLWSNF